MNYYNENNREAVMWLRLLIYAGVIPFGHVDDRSIIDVHASDLLGYAQCHFFAGIGGWPEALRLAEWPTDRPVWTASLPCQPFSAAGRQRGEKDERHLFPVFYRLVKKRRPSIIFGEQVASKLGREWLTGVRTALEGLVYGVGAADLCAASAGAPHIRQRLYWLADAVSAGRAERWPIAGRGSIAGSGATGGMADEQSNRRDRWNSGQGVDEQIEPERHGATGRMVDHDGARLAVGSVDNDERRTVRDEGHTLSQTGSLGSWSRYDIVHCTDGKARRFEPGSFPLAHGVSGRVGLLRGYGNAIVPEVAASFVKAYLSL